jgi:hypothetical protein
MLKNEIDESIDLAAEKWELEELLPSDLRHYFTDDEEIETFEYPVISYPSKIKSIALEKVTSYTGTLKGIKGQYLIFEDNQVINLRKYTGFIAEIIVS